MELAGALALAYLLGSFPTAVLVARAATRGEVDIRIAGTGNPGAANALKVLGAKWGVVILLLDVGKAVLACVLAWALAGPQAANFAGAAAVAGHCYPVWSGFRGGKGVACSVGQCIVTFPVYFPVDLAVALASSRAAFRARAYAATLVSSVCWVAGAGLWVMLDLPNAWGPEPQWPLVAGAVLSSAFIVHRFVVENRLRAIVAEEAT